MSDGVSIRLRDLPDLGYRTSDRPHPRGEILAASDACYFNRDQFEPARNTIASGEGAEGEGWLKLGGVRCALAAWFEPTSH